MDTNEPGREPTEPTDAELMKLLALRCTALHDALGDDGDVTGVRAGERAEEYGQAERALIDRGREYLSGARPMPDTPAPDEIPMERRVHQVAEINRTLSARVAELEAELDHIYKLGDDLSLTHPMSSAKGMWNSDPVVIAIAKRKGTY